MSSSQFQHRGMPCFPKALCSVIHFGCRFSQVSPPTLSTSRERGHLFSSAPLTSRAIFSRGQMAQGQTPPGHILNLSKCTHTFNLSLQHVWCQETLAKAAARSLCFNDCDPSQSAWSAVCCKSRRDPSSSHAVNSHVCTSYVFQL